MANKSRSVPLSDRDAGEETRPRKPDGADPAMASGTPANVDIHDVAPADNPELDWGEPLPGAIQGVSRAESVRRQGPRTLRRNKEINSGRLYRG